MNIEEAKKIMQDKIQADEAAREVRKNIKSYVHQKQDAREGFTETFKPLIETSEKVKESVDTQQNKLIKQLQENQLALTAGFEGNRKAITSGFDKMDEVKKWDLEQLPGHEAIEKSEKKEPEDIIEKIEILDYNIKKNIVTINEITDLENKAIEEGKENDYNYYMKKSKELDGENKQMIKERKRLQKILEKELEQEQEILEEKSEEKQEPPRRLITFDDVDLDSGLNNATSIRFLEENDLLLPSRIQNESYETIKRDQRKAERLLDQYKGILAHKAEFKTRNGKSKAAPLNKNPRTETLQEIQYYNIIGEYVNNMNKLENISRKKEGKGIIHFNNPQQLVSRLELLAGSIIAGNNGVKQEFSQLAHLLYQLKVINKKTLSDLLKKNILFK